MNTKPTHDELQDAMDAVSRLYDLRETYMKVKTEMNRLETEMFGLQQKVWHTLYRVQTSEAATTKPEKGAR